MAAGPVPTQEQLRGAEVAAALCLATDLGMAFPFEHGLRATLIAMRLGERLGVDRRTASDTFYGCLLMYSGCTADAETATKTFGGSLTAHVGPVIFGSPRETLGGVARALPEPGASAPVRALAVARGLPRAAGRHASHMAAICEVAEMLASQLALPQSVRRLFANLTERWDGKGRLGRAKGEEIPLAMRIVHVARDAAFQELLSGAQHAVAVVRQRAGGAFDPEVAACLADGAVEILAPDSGRSAWDETLACEPPPRVVLEGKEIDRALAGMGGVADLIASHFTGHSAAVAELAAAAAPGCRLDAAATTALRRAAFVHDLGRVAVDPKIWHKPAQLSADEWEQVRLHSYQTERVLSRSPFLAALAPTAGAHHECLDGSGYHRGAAGAELPLPARVLAAADRYHAMISPRPYRERITAERAAETLARDASAGRLDADAVTAVVEAAGQVPPRIERPAGLTEREAEVVGMLARGLQTKQVARKLGISVKTADRHVQNAYAKIGVSTRAAATLFAMEHGLVAWGELPIARATPR